MLGFMGAGAEQGAAGEGGEENIGRGSGGQVCQGSGIWWRLGRDQAAEPSGARFCEALIGGGRCEYTYEGCPVFRRACAGYVVCRQMADEDVQAQSNSLLPLWISNQINNSKLVKRSCIC